MAGKHTIIKIIPYFGFWPEWINFFIESCKFNPDIDWLIYTDCKPPANHADNVRYVQMSFEDYQLKVSEKLGIPFHPDNAYKLCDIKPALGFIHQDEIKSYDFYAFGDVDVIYGRLRHFLTPQLLDRYDVIGTHNRRLSGHFALFRNTRQNREAFKKIANWQHYFVSQKHHGIDESKFSKVFRPHKNHPRWLQKLWSVSSILQRRVLFKEQFSTVDSAIGWVDGRAEHPKRWIWHKGRLMNERDEREFMYLHFMNWKSQRWLPKHLRHNGAAWQKLNSLIQVDWKTLPNHSFQISPRGFTAVDDDLASRPDKIQTTDFRN